MPEGEVERFGTRALQPLVSLGWSAEIWGSVRPCAIGSMIADVSGLAGSCPRSFAARRASSAAFASAARRASSAALASAARRASSAAFASAARRASSAAFASAARRASSAAFASAARRASSAPLARLHQLRGVGDAKVLKSLGRSPKGRHYRG